MWEVCEEELVVSKGCLVAKAKTKTENHARCVT